ncbi:MAG: chromosome segregation SMC family protein, partial [Eubacteriales bacterium]
MYLKSLEIHGFKSFPNRTVMHFEPGTTVIVGPNGSGKSNISDAMRWVLGEVSSRNIRGVTMEDVIFGGTETRRQMGYAEVTVVFDNTDPVYRFDSPYDEVSVTRRYFRSGTSEYLINQKPCLRKDVHELFMNTGVGRDGYSIIGQGKVAEMISMKSDERRNIFEEAAGIAKYRHRKHEAELKLDATNRNMETTHMQISMYEEQLIPLEKEADKARRGEAIKEEKKAVDVALWLYDTKKIHEDVAVARVTYETLRDDFAALSETLDKLYAERVELEEARSGAMYDSEGVLANINQIKEQIHQLEVRAGVIEADIGHANVQITQSEGRKLAVAAQVARSEKEIAGYKAQESELDKIGAEIADERLSVLSEQSGILQRLKELESELAGTQKQLEAMEAEATD